MEPQNHLHCDDNLAGRLFQNHYFKPKPRAAAEHEAAIYKYIQTHCPTIPFFNLLACQSGAKREEAAILELQEVITLDDALRSSLLPMDKIRQLIGQTIEVYMCYYAHGLVHNDLKVQNVFIHQDRIVFGDFDRTILLENKINPYDETQLQDSDILERIKRDFSRFFASIHQSMKESQKYDEVISSSESYQRLISIIGVLSKTHEKELSTPEALFEFVKKYVGKVGGRRKTLRRRKSRRTRKGKRVIRS